MRSILFNTTPTCLALDPADRVLYVGSEDGSISSVDFLKTFVPLFPEKSNHITGSAVQEQSFPFTFIENAGAIHCFAISYDSTILLSGHEDGSIHAWDVGKGKHKQIVLQVHQPVTNLIMLRPRGLPEQKAPGIVNATVVKPKPTDPAAPTDNGTSGIPANYNLHAQMIASQDASVPGAEYETSVRNPGFFTNGPFDKSLIDEGLAELNDSIANMIIAKSSASTTAIDDLKASSLSSAMPSPSTTTPPTTGPGYAILAPSDLAQTVTARGRIRMLERELARKNKQLDEANKYIEKYEERRKRARQANQDDHEADLAMQFMREMDKGAPTTEQHTGNLGQGWARRAQDDIFGPGQHDEDEDEMYGDAHEQEEEK